MISSVVLVSGIHMHVSTHFRFFYGYKAREKMLSTTKYQRNASQNYNEVSLHTGQNGHHQKKKLQTINSGEGMEKRETSYIIGGNVHWVGM